MGMDTSSAGDGGLSGRDHTRLSALLRTLAILSRLDAADMATDTPLDCSRPILLMTRGWSASPRASAWRSGA